LRSARERDVAIFLGANTRALHLLTDGTDFPTATSGFMRAAASVFRASHDLEDVMKARITNDRRFLGLDFADWSLLLVGFALAGFLSLYI
jgi:hypothetical protein